MSRIKYDRRKYFRRGQQKKYGRNNILDAETAIKKVGGKTRPIQMKNDMRPVSRKAQKSIQGLSDGNSGMENPSKSSDNPDESMGMIRDPSLMQDSGEVPPPEATGLGDGNNSLIPLVQRYSGPCSDPNCFFTFNNSSILQVERHFTSQHQREVEFIVVCHICNMEIPISVKYRKTFPKLLHMKSHDGDFEQNLLEMEKINLSTLQTKCGLKLSREKLTGEKFN